MTEVRENGVCVWGGGINKKTNDNAILINSTFRFAVIDEALSLLIYKTIHCDI